MNLFRGFAVNERRQMDRTRHQASRRKVNGPAYGTFRDLANAWCDAQAEEIVAQTTLDVCSIGDRHVLEVAKEEL